MRRVRNRVDDVVARPGGRLERALLASRPELVHTHNLPGISTAAWAVAARHGIPVVHTLHDYYLLCPRVTLTRRDGSACEPSPLLCGLRTRRLARWAGAVSAVIGVSEFVLGRHAALFPGAAQHVVRHPVLPPEDVLPPPRAAPTTVGYLGSLDRIKGVDLLLARRPRRAAAADRRRRAAALRGRGGRRSTTRGPSPARRSARSSPAATSASSRRCGTSRAGRRTRRSSGSRPAGRCSRPGAAGSARRWTSSPARSRSSRPSPGSRRPCARCVEPAAWAAAVAAVGPDRRPGRPRPLALGPRARLRRGARVIDTHCHLLPGLDDGPATAADAVALAERLAADGVETVVCTPHFSRRYPTDHAEAGERLQELRGLLRRRRRPPRARARRRGGRRDRADRAASKSSRYARSAGDSCSSRCSRTRAASSWRPSPRGSPRTG